MARVRAVISGVIQGGGLVFNLEGSGAGVGDVLVAAFVHDFGGTTWTPAEAGWTANPNNTDLIAACHRRLTEEPPESYGFSNNWGTSGDPKGVLIVVDPEGDVEAVATVLQAGTGTTQALSIVGVENPSLLLGFWTNDSGLTIAAPPTGMVPEHFDNTGSTALAAYSEKDPGPGTLNRSLTWSAFDEFGGALYLIDAAASSTPPNTDTESTLIAAAAIRASATKSAATQSSSISATRSAATQATGRTTASTTRSDGAASSRTAPARVMMSAVPITASAVATGVTARETGSAAAAIVRVSEQATSALLVTAMSHVGAVAGARTATSTKRGTRSDAGGSAGPAGASTSGRTASSSPRGDARAAAASSSERATASAVTIAAISRAAILSGAPVPLDVIRFELEIARALHAELAIGRRVALELAVGRRATLELAITRHVHFTLEG